MRSAGGETETLPLLRHELWQSEATAMFSVIFEVHPKQEKFDLYLDLAKGSKPILEGIDGFIDNERFESTRRRGWILSHSTWRDEKSVVRWRTVGKHHDTQQRGRDEVFQDYHLRVGEIVRDTAPPAGAAIGEQRLDETEIGRAKFVTLTDVQPESGVTAEALPDWLSVDRLRTDLIDYDVFASIYNAGKHALLASWRDGPRRRDSARPPLQASAIESCASSATTACSIDAKVLSTTPRSRPGRRCRRGHS
jgi:heme-degrading monooxygenase HmoA